MLIIQERWRSDMKNIIKDLREKKGLSQEHLG